MKFTMQENSLFAVLLRSPFWISLAVAVGVFALIRFFLRPAYAAFGALPFVVIACVAGWRQLPLREVHAAANARDAAECIYVAAGEVTDKARGFAAEKNIRLLGNAELAKRLGR